MKDYELDYIIGYLKDKLQYDSIDAVCIIDKLIVRYKWEFFNIDVEVDYNHIDYDILQISSTCKRLICNKVLSLMHKEQ